MQVNKVDKRHIEESQLRQFLQNVDLEIDVCDVERGHDPPDFVINIGNKVISVEVTRIMSAHLKEQEQFRNRIIKEAENLFLEKYKTNLYCRVTFRNIALNGGQPMFRKFSQMLFSKVEEIFSTNMMPQFDVTFKYPHFESPFIETLRVRNTMGFSHWQYSAAYKIDWIDMNILESIIKKKESSIPNYGRHFDENWLLLVSNIGTKASAYRFDFLDFESICTKFHQIYVYKQIEDEIVVIKAAKD